MKYSYQALDVNQQKLDGHLDAGSDSEAARILESRGLVPVRIKSERLSLQDQSHGRIKQQDLLLTLFELVILLRSGVPIADAIESESRSAATPRLQFEFSEIARNLQVGSAFSEALQSSGLQLPEYVYQLVKAGEMTGNLAESLADAVSQMEYERSVGNEFRNALIYPCVLIATGITAVAILFTSVVPKFSNLLDKGDELPLLAYLVLSSGRWCNENGVLLFVLLAALALGIASGWRAPAVRSGYRDLVGRLPLVGAWLREADTARWAKILGLLLANRVALVSALELASAGVEIRSRALKLDQVREAVVRGESLSTALMQNDAVTSSAHNLILVGEKAGRLPEVLASVAALYDEIMRNRMKRLMALIEPLAILIIGVFVGLIIIGIILAITSANNVGA